MLKKSLSKVFIIIVGIALVQIAGTILLARNLTKDEMGLYRLILTIVDIGGLSCLLGIDHAFVRFFSSPGITFAQYNWKHFFKKLSPISLLLIILSTVIIGRIYHFTFFVLFVMAFALIATAVILLFTACLRAAQRYELAVTFSRLHFIIFFLFLLALYFSHNFTFKNVLGGFLTAAACSAVFIAYRGLAHSPSGPAPIPISVVKNGFSYLGLGIATIFLLQINYLLIGKMLSYRDVAIYAVIASIMRIFEFIQDAAYYVLAPHLNSRANTPVRKMFFQLFGVGILTATFYIVFGRALIHILFKGQYDEGFFLLPFFIAIGVLRILYTLPASLIGGRSTEKILRNQLIIAMTAALLNIVLTYLFISLWGLQGAAAASLLTWVFLLLLTLVGTKKYFLYNEADFTHETLYCHP